MKKPLLETFLRIGGKSAIREDYRSARENTELLKQLLADPKHGEYVIEELHQWLQDWDGLDEFVELMLDELDGDRGRHQSPSMRPE